MSVTSGITKGTLNNGLTARVEWERKSMDILNGKVSFDMTLYIKNETNSGIYVSSNESGAIFKFIFNDTIYRWGRNGWGFSSNYPMPPGFESDYATIQNISFDIPINGDMSSTKIGYEIEHENTSLGIERYYEIFELPSASYNCIKKNNIWKRAYPWLKINGIWKRCIIWKKINGIWKKGN